jgi:glycogen debranching enzyme
MQLLANKFDEVHLAERYTVMAVEAQESFNAKFWNGESDCLFDVIADSGVDASLRSNQIITVALDFTMLDKKRIERVLNVVQNELVTPYGLRTLARVDSRYKGMYVGDRRSRDQAYHNGTVWAWLLGPYVTACRKAQVNSNYELKYRLMSLFTQQTVQAGLGTISEIFDGDPPHEPRGCIAQAWSVAEPLRAYLEDVVWIRPKYEKEVLKT